MSVITTRPRSSDTAPSDLSRPTLFLTVPPTGPHGGKRAMHADIAIKAPGETVAHIQEAHIGLYHVFCSMIEAHYFPEYR